MAKVLTAPQLPTGRRITVDDQGSNGEIDLLVVETSGEFPAPSAAHMVFVSSVFGDDTTGDGTMGTPYATIAHALSTITTATAADVWQVFLLPGSYTDPFEMLPFVEVVGFDPTASIPHYPARVTGAVTLSAALLAATNPVTWLTNLELVHDIDWDTRTAVSPPWISMTNVQTVGLFETIHNVSDVIELRNCHLEGDVEQVSGVAWWYGTATNATTSVRFAASIDAPMTAHLTDSTVGGLSADQNANVTPGEIVHVDLLNSNVVNFLSLIASGPNTPVVLGDLGATPENPTLSGSAAVALSHNMRVAKALTIPSGIAILPGETADVLVPLPASVLGATSIETLSCDFTPHGAVWTTELSAPNLVWSFYVVQNGTTSEVHLVIGNINPVGTITTGNPLPFTFSAIATTIAA